MSVAWWMIHSLFLIGQIPAPAPRASLVVESPEARLGTMKRMMESYQLRSVAEPEVIYRFASDPVLRFNNTVGDTLEGAVFLCLGAEGRDAATAQTFMRRDGVWVVEFSSLLDELLTARSMTG